MVLEDPSKVLKDQHVPWINSILIIYINAINTLSSYMAYFDYPKLMPKNSLDIISNRGNIIFKITLKFELFMKLV